MLGGLLRKEERQKKIGKVEVKIVMSYSSVSLFLERKWETVTQGGTI